MHFLYFFDITIFLCNTKKCKRDVVNIDTYLYITLFHELLIKLHLYAGPKVFDVKALRATSLKGLCP